ncbi:MAG: AAC(3) family N-acetyltransferase [Patescibacteria group bacterium]
MIISELKELCQKAGIKKGNAICVFSDVANLGIPRETREGIKDNGINFLLDSYINTFKDLIGEDGLLVMPAFTYSACEGKVFDVDETKSTVGALTERFRKQKGVKRSLHPIFSFSAWGKGAKDLMDLKDFDSFGQNSVFEKLYKMNATYVLFGVNMHRSATFVLYSEQKNEVYYRYFKDFTVGGVTARYFVRDMDVDYRYSWVGLEEKGKKLGIIKEFGFGGGEILIMKSQEIDELIGEELKRDKDSLISK